MAKAPVSRLLSSVSRTAYADAVLERTDLSQEARLLVEAHKRDWAADDRGVVGRPERDRLLGVRASRGRDLEKTVLPAALDGGRRLTPISLIYQYLIDRALESFPASGPAKKAPGAPHMRPHPALVAAMASTAHVEPAPAAEPPRVQERAITVTQRRDESSEAFLARVTSLVQASQSITAQSAKRPRGRPRKTLPELFAHPAAE